jgi:hypothetical protein
MNLQESIRIILREETNKFKGVVGKSYEFDELPKQTKQDIDVQFEDNYDEAPDDYLYKYILVSPEENEEYLFSIFGEWDIEDAKEDPYMKKLIRNIKKRGLDYPAVGTEGNHRALAYYIMNKPLPYLDMVSKYEEE